MSTSWREQVSESLLDSYKPRKEAGVVCAVCEKHGKPLAFHAVEYYQDESEPLPQNFVPMSSSFGVIRGCFPICTDCVRTCRKCELPISSEKLIEFSIELTKKYGSNVCGGNGLCEHMHLSLLFHALFKRIFRIGRFGSAT